MTAATVEATTLATELALETPTARNAAAYLATLADTGVRRQEAARLAGFRRDELTLLRALLLERYGVAPPAHRLEARDDVYVELTLLAIA